MFRYCRYSITTHSLASLSFLHLSRRLIGNWHVSLGAAMLFAAHPVHVEAVAAVVNIAESISCIWYILSYFVFDNPFKKNESTKTMSNIYPIISSIFQLSMWLLLVFVSILFKESALSVCGIVVGKIIIESIHRFSYQTSQSVITNIFRSSFTTRNIIWVLMSLCTIGCYGLLRNVIINGFENSRLDISSAYLSDSQLIRNAENPFAFLSGYEKFMSLMVRYCKYHSNVSTPSLMLYYSSL